MEIHDDEFAITSIGSLLIIVWRGMPTPARIRTFAQASERMLSLQPSGHCYLVVIERSSPPPAAAERAALTRQFERASASSRGYAFVIEGDDARTWIVRTIMRGIAILVRSGITKAFVATVADGITWLNGRMDLGTDRAAIEREVAHLRTLMPPAKRPGERAHATL